MKILAYDYTVKALPTPIDMSLVYGQHNANKLTITICTEMDRQHQESTMLHEILEALDWQMKLELGEPNLLRIEVGLYNALKNAGVDLAPLLKELNNGT